MVHKPAANAVDPRITVLKALPGDIYGRSVALDQKASPDTYDVTDPDGTSESIHGFPAGTPLSQVYSTINDEQPPWWDAGQ